MDEQRKRPDSFERLLKDGSVRSKEQDAKQSSNAFLVWILGSFVASLIFPVFWIFFVGLLLAALIHSGREWMG